MLVKSMKNKSTTGTKELFYYPLFDYLRFVLASVVMFYHGGLIEWAVAGKFAVEVFFALSGWLIGSILLESGKSDLTKFYFNRAVRIWIPYYIAFCLLIIASFLKDPINAKWFEFVFYKLTWVYNLFGPPQLAEFKDQMPLDGTGNHFWSVNVEEQFYLLAPLIMVFLPKFGKSLATWLLIGTLLFVFGGYFSLCAGVIAAIVKQSQPSLFSKVWFRFFGLSVAVACFSLLILGGKYDLYAPFAAVFLVIALSVPGDKSKLGAFLGGISYPLYLNHWIGLIAANVVLKLFPLFQLKHVMYSVFSYAIAALLYAVIDKRIMKLRNSWYTVQRAKVIIVYAYFSIFIGLSGALILNL